MPTNFTLPRAARALVLGALAVLLVPGCASTDRDRPEAYEYEAGAFRPLAESLDKIGYRWDWSGFPAPARGSRVEFLKAWPDAVAAQDSASKLTVLESSSGRVRWSSEISSPLTRFVGLARDRQFGGDRVICSAEAEVLILDIQTGNLISRQRYESVVNTPPLLLGTLGIYGTPDGTFLAHEFRNSARAWAYQASGPIEQPPILAGGVIAGVTQAGHVALIDAGTGTLAGRNRIYGGAAGPLATDGALTFIASLDQSLYAFAPSGLTVWQHRTSRPLAFAPVCIGARLYCHTADNGFTCFNAADGTVLWSNKEVRGTLIGTRTGDLLVWDGVTFSVLEPARGATVASSTLPTIRQITFDRFDNGVMYAVNRAGVVGRFVSKK